MTTPRRRIALAFFALVSFSIAAACSSRSPSATAPPALPSAEATSSTVPSPPPSPPDRPIAALPGQESPVSAPSSSEPRTDPSPPDIRDNVVSSPDSPAPNQAPKSNPAPKPDQAPPSDQAPTTQATDAGAGAAACSRTCRNDADCACGTDTQTNQCAYGNKSCIDTSKQCPDYCTGIGGQLKLRCVRRQCTLQ